MKKLSIRKFSILGLVLLGASAVTAAVIPSNKKDGTSFAGQSITASEGGATQSCSSTDFPAAQCVDTASTGAFPASGSTNAAVASRSNQTTD